MEIPCSGWQTVGLQRAPHITACPLVGDCCERTTAWAPVKSCAPTWFTRLASTCSCTRSPATRSSTWCWGVSLGIAVCPQNPMRGTPSQAAPTTAPPTTTQFSMEIPCHQVGPHSWNFQQMAWWRLPTSGTTRTPLPTGTSTRASNEGSPHRPNSVRWDVYAKRAMG